MSCTLRTTLLLCLAVSGLGACSMPANSGNLAPMASSPPASAAAVTVKDFGYSPSSLSVGAGTTVHFSFVGPSQHSATADDDSWDSGIQAPGGTFDHTFSTPGTYGYHCTIHPSMKGTIVVR